MFAILLQMTLNNLKIRRYTVRKARTVVVWTVRPQRQGLTRRDVQLRVRLVVAIDSDQCPIAVMRTGSVYVDRELAALSATAASLDTGVCPELGPVTAAVSVRVCYPNSICPLFYHLFVLINLTFQGFLLVKI